MVLSNISSIRYYGTPLAGHSFNNHSHELSTLALPHTYIEFLEIYPKIERKHIYAWSWSCAEFCYSRAVRIAEFIELINIVYDNNNEGSGGGSSDTCSSPAKREEFARFLLIAKMRYAERRSKVHRVWSFQRDPRVHLFAHIRWHSP